MSLRARARARRGAAYLLTSRRARQDPTERSFHMNRRIHNVTFYSPTGSTTKEEFPCHASSDYDKSHDEFHRPRRQGEFTKFLQQAILKKVDLAQTGHA